MTDNDENSGGDEENNPDDTTDDKNNLSGLFGSIGDIIEALSRIEQDEDGTRSETGRINRDSFAIDYSYDVNVGIGNEDRPHSESDRSSSEPDHVVDVDEEDDRGESVVQVREYEDAVIVSADLPGVGEDEIGASVNENNGDLIITADGDVIERVSVDPQFSVTDISFSNQILQIRLQTDDGSNDE